LQFVFRLSGTAKTLLAEDFFYLPTLLLLHFLGADLPFEIDGRNWSEHNL